MKYSVNYAKRLAASAAWILLLTAVFVLWLIFWPVRALLIGRETTDD